MDPFWTHTVLQRYVRKIGLVVFLYHFFGTISCAFDTLSLDMRNIQALLESQNDSTKLIVKGIADRKTKTFYISTRQNKADALNKVSAISDVDHSIQEDRNTHTRTQHTSCRLKTAMSAD